MDRPDNAPDKRQGGTPRKWARALLRWALRIAPANSREWAEAMLAELDYVEGDWAALWWALGGVTVLAQRAGSMWMDERFHRWREGVMEQMGKKAGWLILGAFGTVAFSLIALGVQFGGAQLFPQLGLRSSMWIHLIGVIVIPLTISVGFAIWIWRRKRPVALGILLSATVMSAHVILHFALR